MILTLHTEFIFDSAHKLNDYKGICKNLHGHTWRVEVWFKGDSIDKDKIGILVDFNIVKKLKQKLDHKVLNEVINFNPTAENLTEYIYKYLKQKNIETKVRVYEVSIGKQTWCEGGNF